MNPRSGIEAELAKLRAAYVEGLPAKLEELERWYGQLRKLPSDGSCLEELRQRSHKLAGTGGISGLVEMSEAAATLEHLIDGLLLAKTPVGPGEIERLGSLVAKIKLRASDASPSPPVAAAPTAPRKEPRAGAVLVVDDDEELLRLLEVILRAAGFDVTTASTGKTAVATFARDAFDVVLLDVTMPDINGYALCAQLQQSMAAVATPIVFITALATEADRLRAFSLGAVAYLPKPVSTSRLVETVREHVETKRRWADLAEGGKKAPRASLAPGLRVKDIAGFIGEVASNAGIPVLEQKELVRAATLRFYDVCPALGLTRGELAQAAARYVGLEYLPSLPADKLQLSALPSRFCKLNLIVPIEHRGESAFVLPHPFSWQLMDTLRMRAGMGTSCHFLVTDPANIESCLGLPITPEVGVSRPLRAPENRGARFEDLDLDLEQIITADPALAAAEKPDDEASPIVKLVNEIIESAYKAGASDIHIEPCEDHVAIRTRVDGLLRVERRLRPLRLILPLVSRIKIMSGMDIAERRLPQDGRMSLKGAKGNGIDVDLRVAVCPMRLGEKIVMRLLDKVKPVLPLQELGFSPTNLARYREQIRSPFGMVLHAGPTGSGKSMTLYAALNEIKRDSINIQTIEDPIEYSLPGIHQMQVKSDIGLTFARGLRAFLRQDPDVILVGEIRDRETAAIAMEASITGHVIFSTIHSNDAPSTVVRLLEMGIEPFIVSSSLMVVCAQRLVRRLCPHCKKAALPTHDQRQLLEVGPDVELTIYETAGCERCRNTGYKGRVGIHEVMVVNDAVRAEINREKMTTDSLRKVAMEDGGMMPLYHDALAKVREGICDMTDVLSTVRPV